MNTQHFPHFIRANYPEISNQSNATLIEIGDEFKKYLEEKFENKMDKLTEIWDIEPRTIIMSMVKNEPFKIKGYHAALILHFSEFVKKIVEQN